MQTNRLVFVIRSSITIKIKVIIGKPIVDFNTGTATGKRNSLFPSGMIFLRLLAII